MRYCLNPDCPQPQNLSATENCQACGSSLTLQERFDILVQLGRGGYGAAFLAIDRSQLNVGSLDTLILPVKTECKC